MKSDGVVVDANVISAFMKEIRKRNEGELYALIEMLIDHCGLAINDNIEREWKNTAGDQIFDIWFEDNFKVGKIGYVSDLNNLTSDKKRVIRNDYGLPQGRSKEMHYINCSLNRKIKYILTEDIDLYDPKKKEASAKEKHKVKNLRLGALCRFLKKEFGITVGLPIHCYEDLRSEGIFPLFPNWFH